MSANKTKSQTTKVVPTERKDELGIVTKPIVPEGNSDTMKKGVVTRPIVPEGSNPVRTFTPTSEQPTGNDGGDQGNPPSAPPETQTTETQQVDGSE